MSTRREVMTCVTERNLPAMRAAIAAGHSVNECGFFGQSPLMTAAGKNMVEFVRVLLENGAELEATNSFGSTALDEACDCSATETAMLLISRGARGDSQGASGRTPLQLAVKRGMPEIVRALLTSGQADPNTRSSAGKDALYYVQKRDPHAPELRKMLSEYMTLENAIASKNATAIQVVLRRVLEHAETLAESVEAYLQASRVVALESFRVELVLATIAANDTALFERLLVPGVPQPTPQARLEALNALRFATHSGTSALHIAAFYGHADFVEYLLLDCGMDACVEDAKQRRAVQLVDDRKDPSGTVRALLVQTTRRRQAQAFSDRLLACSGGSLDQLEGLAQSLSSVYDLRVVFSLSSATLAAQPDEMKHVLTHAFTRLVNEKLVFNDREALFSKMALRECLRRGYLTAAEFEYWNMQVVKVNMESAAWVAALQQSVRRLDTRIADVEHRAQVLQREYKHLRKAIQDGEREDSSSVGQSLSMVTSLLGVLDDVSGADDSGLFSSVLDLGSPQDVLGAILSASGAGDVGSFVSDTASALSELVVPSELQEKFEAVGVDPIEFAGLLKDAILGEQAEEALTEAIVEEAVTKVLDASDALGDLTLDDDDSKDSLGEETEDEDVGEDPLVVFPFHFAVKHSCGKLAVFQDVIAYIDSTDGDVNALATVTVPTSEATGAKEEEVLNDVSPAVYASYLGFPEIVKFLLQRKDVTATEKRFVTMQRAQQRASKA